MSDLKETLKNDPKGRMVLMLAVADGCKRVIDISFREAYTKMIAECAATTQFDLSGEDKEQFSQLISDALKTVSNDMKNMSLDVADKIIKLENAMIHEMNHDNKIALESIIGVSEISKVDAISAMEAERFILWLVVSDVLKDYALCRETLREASSYKNMSKGSTEKPSKGTKNSAGGDRTDLVEFDYDMMNTGDILKSIHDGKFMHSDMDMLPKKVQAMIQSMREYILHEYDTAAESIANGESLSKDDAVSKMASDLKKTFKYAPTAHADALLRDHIVTGGDIKNTFFAEASVLYSEVVYSIGNIIKAADDPYPLILDILMLPGIYLILTEHSPENLHIEVTIKELKGLDKFAKKWNAVSDIKSALSTFGKEFGKYATFVRPTVNAT